MKKILWDTLSSGYAVFFALALAVFVALVKFIPLDKLIMLLNGAFIGTMFAITVAYAKLFYDAFTDRLRFGRRMTGDVRQMVVSFLAAWAAYGLIVGASFYIRAADQAYTDLMVVALSRYIAILAAIGQITAPDYGSRFFYGMERKFLWGAFALGLVAAVGSIVMQEQRTLAEGDTIEWHG